MHLAFCGHFVASKCILVWLQIAFDADLFARCVAAPPPPPTTPPPPPPPSPAAASHRDPVGAGFSSGCDYGFISGSSSGLATGFGIVAHNLCLCVYVCVCVCVAQLIAMARTTIFWGHFVACSRKMQSEITYTHPHSHPQPFPHPVAFMYLIIWPKCNTCTHLQKRQKCLSY